MGKGIVLAGNLVLDRIYMLNHYPKKGTLAQVTDRTDEIGGIANIARDLARLDETLPLKLNSLIGEDEAGDFVLGLLEKFPNIESGAIAREGLTGISMVMMEEEGKQRTFFYDPGTAMDYDERHIDWDRLDGDMFLLEYLMSLGELDQPDAVYGTKAAKVLHDAKERGMKTVVDVVSREDAPYQEAVPHALKYVDYCIMNELEAEGTTGITLMGDDGIIEENVWAALDKLRDMGVSTWAVIHCPAAGYGIDCKTGERVKVKSLALPPGYIQATNGAGDAYCAGVVYGAYRGDKLGEALKLATGSAACSLSKNDTNSGVVSYQKTLEMYQEYCVE